MKKKLLILMICNIVFSLKINADVSSRLNTFIGNILGKQTASDNKDILENDILTKVEKKITQEDQINYQDSGTNVILGDLKSEIVIEEFTCLSCHGCKTFNKEFFPILKEKYINTNKVKYIIKEQYHSMRDVYANLLLRVANKKGGHKLYLKARNILFEKQNIWSIAKNSRNIIIDAGKKLGISEQEYEEALNDSNIEYELLVLSKESAQERNLISIPSIVINGKLYEYDQEEEIIKILNELTK